MSDSLQTLGDHVAFVNSMDLSHPRYSLPHNFQSRLKLMEPPDNEREGYIVGGAVTAFTQNVSGRAKQDILDITLFAQLAADKRYDRVQNTREWYNFYNHILGNAGFSMQDFHFRKYESHDRSLTMDEVVVEILAAIATGGESEVVEATLDAMRRMSNDDRKIELFKAHCTKSNLGNFQVVACEQAPGGEVSLTLGAFIFGGSETDHGILFFSWSTQDTHIQRASQKAVLNTAVYERIRSTIASRIGDNAVQMVASIDI